MNFKKIIALVLSAILCLGISTSAFADGYSATTDTRTPAESGIVKTLAIAEGVTLPDVDYTFSLTPGTASEADGVFAASAQTVTIAKGDMTKNVNMYTGSKTISEIFGTTTAELNAKGITHAGVWIYTVKETTPAINETTTDADGVKTTKTLNTDANEYTLRLYVTNTADGGIAITNVTVEKGNEKVDPKILETTTEGEGATGTSANASGFKFENIYKESVEHPVIPDPTPTPGETGALTVKKSVVGKDGNASDYANKSRQFPIIINVTKPATMESTDELNSGVAYIILRAATPENPAGTKEEGTLAYGSNTVQLSDGDVLSVAKMAVGTEYVVSEPAYATEVDHYKTKDISAASGTLKTTDTTGLHPVVTNEFDDGSITPTGIVVNNLPFAMIVVLALAGIAATFVANRRRSEEA